MFPNKTFTVAHVTGCWLPQWLQLLTHLHLSPSVWNFQGLCLPIRCLYADVGLAMTHKLLANEMKTVLERAGDAELALIFATAISTSPEDWAGG